MKILIFLKILFKTIKKIQILFLAIHDGEEALSCNKCDARFTEKEEFSNHIDSKHDEL